MSGTIHTQGATATTFQAEVSGPLVSEDRGAGQDVLDYLGFFSNLKRGIAGTYHSVSSRWLPSYLNEYAWRYNERDNPRSMFESLLDNAGQP